MKNHTLQGFKNYKIDNINKISEELDGMSKEELIHV